VKQYFELLLRSDIIETLSIRTRYRFVWRGRSLFARYMERRTVSLGVYILACILSRHCL